MQRQGMFLGGKIMSKNSNPEEFKLSLGDVGHTAVKIGLSMIPLVGGAVAELFNTIITPPLLKRRDEWLIKITSSLKNLEEKVEDFKIENLSENPLFITVFMDATQTAIRNHQEEKLEALKNAILNTALNITIEENTQLIFLNLVDVFTPWHLKILQVLNDPLNWNQQNEISINYSSMSTIQTFIETSFPELKEKKEFCNKIIKDLYSEGLISIDSIKVMMSTGGILQSRTTKLGKDFIRYIGYSLS